MGPMLKFLSKNSRSRKASQNLKDPGTGKNAAQSEWTTSGQQKIICSMVNALLGEKVLIWLDPQFL